VLTARLSPRVVLPCEQANYGKSSEEAVASVKALYRDLKLEQAFFDYEQASHERLTATIDEQTLLPKQVLARLQTQTAVTLIDCCGSF